MWDLLHFAFQHPSEVKDPSTHIILGLIDVGMIANLLIMVIIHLGFALSAVVLAWTDKLMMAGAAAARPAEKPAH
jgi:uncharacterized membrane protein YqhA